MTQEADVPKVTVRREIEASAEELLMPGWILPALPCLLRNKNAVIYGGGGAIGGAVAHAFPREGAKVFLAGRTLAKLDRWPGRFPPQEAWPR